MPSFDLPVTIEIPIMKQAGLSPVEFEPERVQAEGARVYLARQGAKYAFDAAISHLLASRKPKNGEAAGPAPTAEEFEKVVNGVLERLYAEEWVARARGEAEPDLDPETAAYYNALKPRFEKAGVLRRGKAGKPAEKDSEGNVTKAAVPAVPAVTVRTIIEGAPYNGDIAAAARAIGEAYLTKQGMKPENRPAALDRSWKAVQDEVALKLAAADSAEF